MSPLTIELCKPIEAHARQVMAFRNDPQSLRASIHQEPKTWPAFFEEFKRDYFTHTQPPCFFVCQGKERVGFVRFRKIRHPQGKKRKCVDISLMVAPHKRKMGLGPQILELAKQLLQPLAVDVIADIRSENAPSIRCFEKAGFRPISPSREVGFERLSCRLQ